MIQDVLQVKPEPKQEKEKEKEKKCKGRKQTSFGTVDGIRTRTVSQRLPHASVIQKRLEGHRVCQFRHNRKNILIENRGLAKGIIPSF